MPATFLSRVLADSRHNIGHVSADWFACDTPDMARPLSGGHPDQAMLAPRRPRAAQLTEYPDGVWGLRRGRLFARRTLQPALIRRANALRLLTIVITNQAGVGRPDRVNRC